LRNSILGIALILALSFDLAVQNRAVAAPPAQPAAVSGSAIVQFALRYLGYPYTTVGNSPSLGFSCIGFVSYVYQSNGIPLPDDLWDAMAYAPQIPFSDLQPGDVLYFQNTVWAGLSHTAIYIGGGRFVQAEWYNRGVVISSFTNDPIDGNYWQDHYLGANRPWAVTPPAPPASTDAASSSSDSALRSGPHARVDVLGLNIRARPSLHAAVSALATEGTSVVVLKHYRQWYWVQLPSGGFGWVAGAGIGKGASSFFNNSPFVRPQIMASVRVDALDVRQRPGLQSPVAGAVYAGEKLHVYGHWNGWLWVTASDGTLGWVKRSYVAGPALKAESTGPSLSRLRSDSTRPSLSQLRSEALKAAFENQGASNGSAANQGAGNATDANQGAAAGRLTAAVSVNVRNAPATSGVIVDLIPPGGTYRILGRAHRWAYVLLPDGTRGFASLYVLAGSHSVRRSSLQHQPHAGNLRRRPVLTAVVLLHARPGVHSAVLGLAASGTHVRILKRSGKWLRVRLPSGRVGYVYRAYVKR
jgi:uncharacterized protein YgiM (DUF1202 family)